jgi:hypothetical protein
LCHADKTPEVMDSPTAGILTSMLMEGGVGFFNRGSETVYNAKA